MFHKTYRERLHALNLITLEERRIYTDLIYLFKIIHGKIDTDLLRFFSFNQMNTRGHRYKLLLNISRINCHKYHFCNRVIKPWNDLPNDVINSESVDQFKQRLLNIDVKRYCIGSANTA